MVSFAICAGVTAVATAFMIAPGRVDKEKANIFSGRNYAHRGLHSLEHNIPENSLSAFRAAKEQGFGIELDLQITADGQVVVFHDYTTDRVCGVSGHIDKMTYEELLKLRLSGTDEHIPLFSEVLELMDGKQPLVIEIKTCLHRDELCEGIYDLVKDYNGEFCIESFDPFTLSWFRRNAPHIVRGQLSAKIARWERQQEQEIKIKYALAKSFVISNVFLNCLSRPHFIAHRLEKKSLAVRAAEKMGAMRFAWTSKTPGNESMHDSIIFEGYVPEPCYNRK